MDSPFSFERQMELNSNRSLTEKGRENFEIEEVPIKNGDIVLMEHPASITLYQYLSVEVLSGSISIFGYEISRPSKPIEIFSSEKTGLIQVKTEASECIWTKKECFKRLEGMICEITHCEKKAKSILTKIGSKTVVIFIKRRPYPVNVQCFEFYYPHILEFCLHETGLRPRNFIPKPDIYSRVPIQFDSKVEELASQISFQIRGSKLSEMNAPRILVCGPKQVGKSSLLRFLVNKVVSAFMSACYLETDPGQPEFTPPGVVSLTKVNKPVFGPPFMHQRKPISMIFTGNVSPAYIDMYKKSVSQLVHLYRKNYADETLFVNTMGWMEGAGLNYLKDIIAAVQPTVLVEIVPEFETSMFDYRSCMPAKSHYYYITGKIHKSCIHPRESRELCLLSHLGKSQSEYLGPMYLNEVKPYCVSWDRIPVYVFPEGNLHPSKLIVSLNKSIIALCSVPKSAILKTDAVGCHSTLVSEPDNECLAYGLVQAIDEKEHLLYIVSPLKSDHWRYVNAIIKGKIMIPDSFILNENIYDLPLPYTNDSELQDDEDAEEMETSMISLKGLFEPESSTENLNVRPAIKKRIKKRSRIH